jgi:hypothetical protein
MNQVMNTGTSRAASRPDSQRLRSCQCTQAQLQSETFQSWIRQMREQPMHMHRKLWEYASLPKRYPSAAYWRLEGVGWVSR